jgi:hypothetical protein
MTLFFSLSAFAYGYDEYGGNSGWNSGSFGSPVTNTGAMTSGGNFWSTNTSAMVSNNGVVTNNFTAYNPQYYVGSGGNTSQTDNTNWQTAPSITQYVAKSGDIINLYFLHTDFRDLTSPLVTDANGNPQFGFIITNQGSIMQPVNNYSGYTPQQLNNAIMGIGNYNPNPPVKPYFTYNNYNSSTNTNTVTVYQATPTGPVVVKTKEIITYNSIPRVGTLGFTAQPPPEFSAAAQLTNKTSFTVEETAQYIEKYIDRVFEDIAGPGGRFAQVEGAIAKLVKGLPDDQKSQAIDILMNYMSSAVVDDDTTVQNQIIEDTDYVFDEKGGLKAINSSGTGQVQITTKDGLKSPSQLDINNLDHRKALSKVAVFLAKKLKAPVGTTFSSGTSITDPKSIAYTEGAPPHIIKFNYKSGTFDKSLDNIYNFTSVIAHEVFHYKNDIAPTPVESNLSTHIDVYLNQMKHTSFTKTTDDNPNSFKPSIIRSMAIYILNMDKKKNPDNTFKYNKADVKDKMDTFNNLNLHYKLVYPVPDWDRGSLTIHIKDSDNPLKTPEDANEKYYTINEK